MAAMVILLVGMLAWLYLAGGREQAIDSLAVLPLVNASGDAEMEYLSDGITEGIINSLSQLPRLRVMARSAVFSYKGKQVDLRKVGHDLNVRAVLTGRVNQRGDTLVIVAELVSVADGSQLWGEQYTPKLADLLAVQAEIVKQISEKLRLTLTGEDKKRLTKSHTENAEAFLQYTRGRYYSNKSTAEEKKKGIAHLRQAVDLDPAYALAWGGLAASYFAASTIYLQPKEAMPLAKAAATKALQLDETLAEAHAVLAIVKGNYEWDWAEAEKEFKRALALNPSYAPAHQLYGWYLAQQGRVEEAIPEMSKAHELDPLWLDLRTNLAWFHYLARRHDEAITQYLKILELDPNFLIAHYSLGLAYEQKGMFEQALTEFHKAGLLDRESPYPLAFTGHGYAVSGKRDEARRVLDELKERRKQRHIDALMIAVIYVALEEKNEAFEWLEKAYQERSEELMFLKVDPRLDSLRSDPRFIDLVRRLGLAP